MFFRQEIDDKTVIDIKLTIGYTDDMNELIIREFDNSESQKLIKETFVYFVRETAILFVDHFLISETDHSNKAFNMFYNRYNRMYEFFTETGIKLSISAKCNNNEDLFGEYHNWYSKLKEMG